MTLEKQIEIMKGWAEKASTQMAFPVLFEKDIAQLLEWLEDYKQLKEHFEILPEWLPVWVSCEEAMPKNCVDVLIYVSRWKDTPFQVAHLEYDGVMWEMSDEEYYFSQKDVTHWIPLPKPPKAQ